MITLGELDYLKSIWSALRRIEEVLGQQVLPPEALNPTVIVDPPDLSEVTAALRGLEARLTPEEFVKVISLAAPPAPPETGSEALAEIVQALKKLDFRMQGLGTQAYGGGSVSLLPNQTVGISNWDEMPAQSGTQDVNVQNWPATVTTTGQTRRTMFDYGARTDAQPIYLGKAPPNSSEANPVWTIIKSRYESAANDARLMEMDIRTDVAWTNRATPTPAWGF